MLTVSYVWWILALSLIAGEVIAPGFFLLWIGLAAATMGVVGWLAPGLSLLVQAVLFAIFAFASCYGYTRWVRPALDRHEPGDAHLNHRGSRMVGQRYELVEPIVNGRGKARVGDGQWLVNGPDLPVGSTVEVFAVDGATLQVRLATDPIVDTTTPAL